MHRRVAITIMALSFGGCFILTSPPSSAQSAPQQEQKKAQGQSRGAGSAGVPSGGGGSAIAPRGGARAVTPSASRAITPHTVRTVTPSATRTISPRAVRTVTPSATRTVTPHTVRTVTPKATRAVTPHTVRTVTPKAPRTVTPRAVRTVTPKATRTVTPRVVAPRVAPTVTLPSGGNARVVTAGRLRGVPVRGAGRAMISGHNFSVWRSGYRVRHGSAWRTFIALSALSAIAVGSRNYYPYAYIAASEPYCEGLTEDGCRLMWQEVETLEGEVVNQCVAYCPWQ
jgi:hypothetical protein